MNNSQKIEYTLERLKTSKFRSSFHLSKSLLIYTREKGMKKIRDHAYDLVSKKIKDAYPLNDGKQTPMRGHPVFIAMHACACCCRSCLFKWHKIPKYRKLTEEEITYIVDLLMEWIKRESTKAKL